jgi:hypothetical protein
VTVNAKRVVPQDEGAAKKQMRYVPWWAVDDLAKTPVAFLR